MAGPVFTNNAVGTLAAAYSASATALTLTAGQGALFPAPGAGEWFPVTIVNASNQIEIVRCTGRTSDTLTVLRGQEGTGARALAAGEKVEHRMTAALLAAIRDKPIDPSQIPAGSIDGSKIAPNSIASAQIVDGSIQNTDIGLQQVGQQHLYPGAALANLGFTPVQQGGGAGQNTNKIYLGWSAASLLKAQVDGTDYGYILPLRDDGNVSLAGFRGMPLNVQNNDYVFSVADIGKSVGHTSGSHTYTIPPQSSIAWQNGAIIKVNNMGGGVVIAPGSGVALVWIPSGTQGARTLTAPGGAVIENMYGDVWWVYGANLT